MDVYLSEEALVFLRAQTLRGSGSRPSGLLLGHKRGGRFFVERVYPCPRRSFSQARGFWALEKLFHGKIIGFYAFGARTEKTAALNQPFAFNKVWLKLETPRRKKLNFQPSLIEYNGSFFLRPLSLAALPEKKK
ncbi:MAG: hypothetical protein AB1715_07020 [Acidobacteriota bacterium]